VIFPEIMAVVQGMTEFAEVNNSNKKIILLIMDSSLRWNDKCSEDSIIPGFRQDWNGKCSGDSSVPGFRRDWNGLYNFFI
jgi:hypothetical protein